MKLIVMFVMMNIVKLVLNVIVISVMMFSISNCMISVW